MATRAERRRHTLLTLGDAAIDLFDRQGPSVTVEDIAARAGVSRRTVFRHVETREELAFVHPILWFEHFDDALDHHRHLPLPDRLLAASRAIAAAVDADPEPPRRAFLVAAAHPELHRGFHRVFQRWVDRIALEVEADRVTAADRATEADPFRSRVIGAAVMGMVDAATRQWVLSPPSITYRQLCDAGFEVVAPLFD